MQLTAVIDNASLVNLTYLKHLHIFRSLQLLFSQIHIPAEVRKEYEVRLKKEPERAWLLERLRPNEGFYSFCTRFDTLSFDILKTKKGIDKGEAEAAAQQKEVNAHYVLSDDIHFQKAIRSIDSRIKIVTTLHIIAMLDIRQFLQNRDEIIKTLHSVHPFNSSSLRLAYNESARELGISISKKVLNDKCSLKKMGLPKTLKRRSI